MSVIVSLLMDACEITDDHYWTPPAAGKGKQQGFGSLCGERKNEPDKLLDEGLTT